MAGRIVHFRRLSRRKRMGGRVIDRCPICVAGVKPVNLCLHLSGRWGLRNNPSVDTAIHFLNYTNVLINSHSATIGINKNNNLRSEFLQL